MQVSSFDNQNFKGIYVLKKTTTVGEDTFKKEYVYHPFANESKAETKKAIDKYNGKTIESYYNDNEYPCETSHIKVSLGSKLDITDADYKNSTDNLTSTNSSFLEKVVVG